MNNRELTDLMRDIDPRFQKKADARASEASAPKAQKSRLPMLLTVGAAACCIAGGAVILPHLHPQNTIPAEPPAAEDIAAQPADSEVTVMNAPFADFSADAVRLMAPAYAPYVLDISPEQQQMLAETLLSAQWNPAEPADADAAAENGGEVYSVFVWNGGDPYCIRSYPSGYAEIEQGGAVTGYQITDAAEAAIAQAANPAAMKGHLTWCDPDTLRSTETVWKNIRLNPKPCDMKTQEGIFYKIRNAVDYFDRASGSVVWSENFTLEGQSRWQITVSDFCTDLKMANARETLKTYFEKEPKTDVPASEPFDTVTVYKDPCAYYVLSQSGELRSLPPETMLRCNDSALENDEVHSILDGADCWNYRNQITNCSGGAQCLEPKEMALGYLYDFDRWEISGTGVLEGRDVVHLRGTLTGAYSEKLRVTDFEFDVDIETGVLLRYAGYDADGNLSDYMITYNIAFDDDAAAPECADLLAMPAETGLH
ncbi:MAG TPA: hypothetical protein DDX71_01170 [Ruminococcus sp.]|nr:hypothetical protein [Ruminococcus sp.]